MDYGLIIYITYGKIHGIIDVNIKYQSGFM
jgi:hypothetical protein